MSAKENSGCAPGISSDQGNGENTKSSGFISITLSLSLHKRGGAISGVGEKLLQILPSIAVLHGNVASGHNRYFVEPNQ